MTKLTTNFTLEELLASQRAAREGWAEQFNPPPEVLANLKRVAQAMEIVRAILNNHPIIISSGYRCQRVNEAVGGAKNSAHMLGFAVDFTCPKFETGKPLEVCRRLAATKHLEFDQIIYEFGAWCHFAVGPGTRRQCLSIFHGDPTYYLGILEAPGGTNALIS